MTYLVGDIGGTNTRLALADVTGILPASVMRARNDAYESLDAVLTAYLQQTAPDRLAGVCIAIAGPVQAGKGTLTNRNWSLDVASLRAQTGAPHAELINDLAALGYALTRVSTKHVFGPPQSAANGQRLVVGMGTGFNVSPTRLTPAGVVAMESELGHADLPASVSQLLQEALGTAAQPFNTYEDCFSGKGLERLHAAVSGEKQDGKSIMESFAAGQPDAQRTVHLFARALGRMIQSVMHQFMPRDGIAFAGSASLGILTSQALPAFIEELTADHHGIVDAHQFPISLITEDVAALQGCLQYLSQTS